MNIIQALNDPKVFANYFKAESWNAWRVFLAALYGLPLTYDQLQLYTRCTGRSTAPTQSLNEALAAPPLGKAEKSWLHFRPTAVDVCGSRLAIGATTERARAPASAR